MISQREMLDIIRTEALEPPEPGPLQHREKESEPEVQYDLRLVRRADGSLAWED